jgi:hypothetical protein
MQGLAFAVIMLLLFYAIFVFRIFILLLLLCVCIKYIPCSMCRESTKCIIFVLRGCMIHPYLKERCVKICYLIY